MSAAESALIAAVVMARPNLPPDVIDQVVASTAHGSAILASAFALALVGDLDAAAEVLRTGVTSADPDRAGVVTLTAQLAIGIGVIAARAAADGGLAAALAAVHERAALYRAIADRDDDGTRVGE